LNNGEIRSPKFARWLLKYLLSYSYRQTIIGDFEEEYKRICAKHNMVYSWFWFWLQVVKSVPSFMTNSFLWKAIMFKNYIKIALRNITRYKAHSFLNISGLALGLACCILLLLWIRDEISYDKFHKNSREIYRIIGNSEQILAPRALTPTPLGPALKNDYPEIINFCRYDDVQGFIPIKTEGKTFTGLTIAWVDQSFFDVFDFPLKIGDPESVLNNTSSVVISESMSKRLFGDNDPIGKILNFYRNDHVVTGVLKDVPRNSHLQFDCLISFQRRTGHSVLGTWEYTANTTYLLLQPGLDLNAFSQKIEKYLDDYLPQFKATISLQPLLDIHLHSNFLQGDTKNINQGNASYVYLVAVITFLIFAVCTFNFMNLSTAKSTSRAKEVGVRKVTGAIKTSLMKQFFGESLLLSYFAMLIAVIITALLIPVFNNISGKFFSYSLFFEKEFIVFVTLIGLFTGVVSGLYPALYLSSFQPVNTIKGIFNKGTGSTSIFRKALVYIQFVISVFLIICVSIIYKQLNYMTDGDLGWEKENIITVGVISDYVRDSDAIRNELNKNPNILGITKGFQPVWREIRSTSDIDWDGKNPNEKYVFQCYNITPDYLDTYIDTYKMEVLEGRNFSRELVTDTLNFIVNEEAAKVFGESSPVGRRFSVDGREGKIIGVIKNFHHSSFRHKIEPIVLRAGNALALTLRIRPENRSETLRFIEDLFQRAVPTWPYEHIVIEDTINNFYISEKRLSSIYRYATALAIVVACLGLIGLSSYMAEVRTKEIGIRKILGATVSGIFRLISQEFIILVLASNLIAWPVAWFCMKNWLEDFAYRIELSPHLFFLAGVITLFVALLTVSFHAIKAARKNPVLTLKYE